MKKIYKYKLELLSEQVIKMPSFAQNLTVQVQYDVPCIWALVETEMPLVDMRFLVLGTGSEVPDGDLAYVGTFQLLDGKLVYHVFRQLQ